VKQSSTDSEESPRIRLIEPDTMRELTVSVMSH